jgi:hypothetical protein
VVGQVLARSSKDESGREELSSCSRVSVLIAGYLKSQPHSWRDALHYIPLELVQLPSSAHDSHSKQVSLVVRVRDIDTTRKEGEQDI